MDHQYMNPCYIKQEANVVDNGIDLYYKLKDNITNKKANTINVFEFFGISTSTDVDYKEYIV